MTETDSRRPTIYDVAERAGVSKSLVSLVLRGSDQVSEARRTAVMAAIAELDYRPSQAATMLASSQTRNIEVVVDDYRNLSFVGIVRGMREALAGRGYYLTVTESQLVAPDAGLHSLSPQADGKVFAAEPTRALLAGWSGPTVVAGWRELVPAGADFVASDDEHGGLIAATHLLSLGHRRVGHLSGPGGPAYHRRLGYTKAMESARLRPRVVARDGTSEDDGYEAAALLLERHPDTTAIFAANDVMAVGAMAAVRERGLVVPQDVSLIGYDNSPLAQSRYLALTSVDDRSTEVGATAAGALLARIGERSTAPIHTLVEPELIVRGTTVAAAVAG